MFNTVRTKIVTAFAIIMLMLIGSTAVNVTLSSAISNNFAAFHSALDRKTQLIDMDLTMQKVRVRINQWMRSHTSEFAAQADQLLFEAGVQVEQVAADTRAENERQIARRIDRAFQAYIESWRVVRSLYADETKLYDERIVIPAAKIRAALASIRDNEALDPRTRRLAMQAHDEFMMAETLAARYQARSNSADAAALEVAVAASLQALKGIDTTIVTPIPSAEQPSADAAIKAWQAASKEAATLRQTSSARIDSWTTNEGEVMMAGARALRLSAEAAAEAARLSMASEIDRNDLICYGLDGAIILAGMALSLVVARSITRPLMRTIDALKRLAAGDHTLEIVDTHRRDEIGEMARATEIFRDKVIEVDRLNEEQAAAKLEATMRQEAMERYAKRFSGSLAGTMDKTTAMATGRDSPLEPRQSRATADAASPHDRGDQNSDI